MLLSLVLVVVSAQPSVELFQDKGEFFARAGSSNHLQVGLQLKVLGAPIGGTSERRSAGRATVLEVWPTLARVSLDSGARSGLTDVPEGQSVGLVELPEELPPLADSPPAPAAAIQERYGSFYIDPLGLITFGPTLGVEFGSDRFSLAIYGRWFSAGLLSTLLILNPGDVYDFSFGLGLRGRFYFRPGLSGAHMGLAAEWLRPVVENDDLLLLVTSNYLVPQVEGGYRWAGSRFFIDLSGGIGFSYRLFWRIDNLPGGNLAGAAVAPAVASFFFSAKLELGVFF